MNAPYAGARVLAPGSATVRSARLRSRGLPKRLPAGERLLWQGAPDARSLMVRTFHVRAVTAYFALILVICAVSAFSDGASAHDAGLALLRRGLLAAVPVLLIVAYSIAIARTTVYSITNKRVVISFGMALPMSFNVPFSRLQGAGLRLYPDGTGDVPLQLLAGEQMSYLVLWPHARPWRMARTEPMLRCIAGAAEASTVLGQALADELNLPHTETAAFGRLAEMAVA